MVETLNEYYEEDEDEELLEPSGCICVSCENEIHLTEEVFLLRVVHPFVENGTATYYDILDEYGQYIYEPAFFDFGCLEDDQEEVQEIQEDVPPVQHPDGIILCDLCESDILQGETMGLLQFGEIRLSERAPNNQDTPVFEGLAPPTHWCIGCLTHLEDKRTDPIWQNEFEPVPGVDVCIEGIFERCWRGGRCDCPKRVCGTR